MQASRDPQQTSWRLLELERQAVQRNKEGTMACPPHALPVSHLWTPVACVPQKYIWNSMWGMDSMWLLWSEMELQPQLCDFPAAQPWVVTLSP